MLNIAMNCVVFLAGLLAVSDAAVLNGADSHIAPSVKQYVGHQVVQVFGADTRDAKALVESHVHEVFRRDWNAGGMTAHVSGNMIENLKANGFEVKVVVDELASHMTKSMGDSHPLVRRENKGYDPVNPDAYWLQYHHYTEKYKYWEVLANTKLAENVPASWLVYKKIGVTLEKRPIYAFELGNPKAKELIAVEGGIHAREWVAAQATEYTLASYIKKLASGKFNAMFEEFKFIFVPMQNVDGYRHSYLNDRMHRKNMNKYNDTCIGVDLNRNYNGNDGWKLSADHCSNVYGGPKPYSEPETQVMKAYWEGLAKKHNMLAFFQMHTYAEYLVFPHGYDFDLPPAPNHDTLQALGTHMCEHMNLVHGESYIAWNAADWYPAYGATDDYWYDKVSNGPWNGKGLVYTVELRPVSKDPIGFVLPANQILPACEEWLAGYDAAVVWIMKSVKEHKAAAGAEKNSTRI